MLDNKQARALLQRSPLSYLVEILWRSALLTAVLALVDYLSRPKFFDFNDVWINLAVIVVFFSILQLLSLLLAAARYRDRFEKSDDD